MATDTAQVPAARAPLSNPAKRPARTPQRLQKQKLTLSEAADQWERSKREIDRLKPLLEESAAVLLEHFEKTHRATYKDRIARQATGGSLVLDQPRIREYLGAKLHEFQKRTPQGWTLKLLH